MSSGVSGEQVRETVEHGRPSLGIRRRIVGRPNEFGEALKPTTRSAC
jgi:hypothetical protein